MCTPEQGLHRPTVTVIDCCTPVREAFQSCFPSLTVVGGFATVEEFLGAGIDCDLVVVDVRLDGHDDGALSGPAAVAMLTGADYRVCVFSAERRILVLARCLALGASGLAWKSDSLAVNEEILLAVAQGGVAISASLEPARELIRRRGAPPALTLRQRQVLHARARGESWQGLADRLGISAKTAYDRLECVRAKLAWFLQDAGLGPDASPADIEYALGLAPGDGLMEVGAVGLHRSA